MNTVEHAARDSDKDLWCRTRLLVWCGWQQRGYEHIVHVNMLTGVTASCVHVDISAASQPRGSVLLLLQLHTV